LFSNQHYIYAQYLILTVLPFISRININVLVFLLEFLTYLDF